MKIYTKTGDSGQTSLFGGDRVLKSALIVEAYGTIDELNAAIGAAKSFIKDDKILSQLKKIQFDLFTLGSESATPADKLLLANGKSRLAMLVSEKEIAELELWIDDLEKDLEPLKSFILPAGGRQAAHLHIARTVCRRAERLLVRLDEVQPIRLELLKYMNRLSDYLFTVARYMTKITGNTEEFWITS